MIDVSNIEVLDTHVFMDTGSPHHVEFLEKVKEVDVKSKGAKIRYGAPYFEEGSNVNFVEQLAENRFKVRTYERGVEDETLACGTGVTAVAIAAHETKKTSHYKIEIEVLGGLLEVSFQKNVQGYTDVYLKGPAEFTYEGSIDI